MKQLVGILLLFLLTALLGLIISYVSGFTLNDIFPPRDITLRELNQAVAPHTSPNKPAIQETTHTQSLVTFGTESVQVDCYVIVESFKNLTQARQRAEELINNYNTNFIVLPPTAEGYYRISCGKYSTLVEAESEIRSIRTNIRSDAWILSVKK